MATTFRDGELRDSANLVHLHLLGSQLLDLGGRRATELRQLVVPARDFSG